MSKAVKQYMRKKTKDESRRSTFAEANLRYKNHTNYVNKV